MVAASAVQDAGVEEVDTFSDVTFLFAERVSKF
jgi:hypothetical protein